MLLDWVNEAIFGTISKILTDLLSWAFSLMTDLILNLNRIDQYFNYNTYLSIVKYIAFSLLIVNIGLEVIKKISGEGNHNLSLSSFIIKVCIATGLIFILPWSVESIFMRVNNAFINIIKSIGINFEHSTVEAFLDFTTVNMTPWAALFIFLVLVIGFLIIGILSGIRYIELIICILFAPFAAIKYIKSTESVNIWTRETVALVFTQTVHFFLLQMLAIILAQNMSIIVKPLLVIGVLIVMIRSPQIIRKLTYSTGMGGASVSMAGQAGRLAAMRMILK